MATKPRTTQERREAEQKAEQTAITRLGLADRKEALLCLPASYDDCRQPARSAPDEDDEDRKLYLLRLTGNFYGYEMVTARSRPMVSPAAALSGRLPQAAPPARSGGGLGGSRLAMGGLGQARATVQIPQRAAPAGAQPAAAVQEDDDEQGVRRNWRLVANFGQEGWEPGAVKRCQGGRCDVELEDQDGNIVVWKQFGGAWNARRLFAESSRGDPVVLVGKMERRGRRYVLSNAEPVPPRAIGGVWTKYLGITGRVAGDAVERVVLSQVDNPDAYLHCATKLVGATGLRDADALRAIAREDDTAQHLGIKSFEQLLRSLHKPKTPQEGQAARDLANRLSTLALQADALRHHSRPAHPQAPLAIDHGRVEGLMRSVEQQLRAAGKADKLTGDQRKCILEIAGRFTAPKPLTGLLTGDVGTGKTLTYMTPAVAAHLAGARVAIMAPTEMLADQIAREAIAVFGELGARVERVPTGAKKLHDPEAIMVSTYGFASTAKRAKWKPHVLVFDEQHKMSTNAREALVEPWTHVLEGTATPIPRSLAAALYGGMQVFTLNEQPVVKKVHSFVYDVKDRPRGAGMLRWALDNGKKAAVIYPVVDGGEDESVQSVKSGAAALEKVFPGKVAILHGGMSSAEKAAMMDMIRSGERPIVVASTVMETGIDLPSMAGMIVRNADRFGASQLHQLRGRLVRNGGEGWFMMMVEDLEKTPPDALQRLQAVAATTNGYELAELDLVQRGFGDLDGADQSGRAETIFRLVRLRPEDFIRQRLKEMAVEARPAAPAAPEHAAGRREAGQVRLFG